MSSNATLALSLYAHVDPASLNWLERYWMTWYIWLGNPILATGLMSFLVHEVCPVSLMIVYLIYILLLR